MERLLKIKPYLGVWASSLMVLRKFLETLRKLCRKKARFLIQPFCLSHRCAVKR